MEKNTMNYKISDSVAMRMIQIFQEAIVFGIDGADLMRQVRLVQDPEDSESLTLDPTYVKSVEEMHQKYLEEANSKKSTLQTS